MTLTEFSLKAIGKIKPLRSLSQSICRSAVSKTSLRRQLNKLYNNFNYKERVMFHYLFSPIFRDRIAPNINDKWHISFNNKTIYLPLSSNTLWLDWDLAVSIVGHDLEIKEFYKNYINSINKPINFFDIGANYGTHSILFLSQDAKVITFEPNPECKPIFERFLELNSLKGQLERVAVGDAKTSAELVFPKKDTWNGSLQNDYQNDLSNFEDLIRLKVDVITLDDYVSESNIKPDIIKIDTEGFELNVLKGARKTLTSVKPIVVFESNKADERKALFLELRGVGYNVYEIEKYYSSRAVMSENQFIQSDQYNFVAVPN